MQLGKLGMGRSRSRERERGTNRVRCTIGRHESSRDRSNGKRVGDAVNRVGVQREHALAKLPISAWIGFEATTALDRM